MSGVSCYPCECLYLAGLMADIWHLSCRYSYAIFRINQFFVQLMLTDESSVEGLLVVHAHINYARGFESWHVVLMLIGDS